MSAGWPKVEELIPAALERAPAEREAFLREICGGDEELRREVQSLLAHEAELAGRGGQDATASYSMNPGD
jgi:hypothetical protein